MFGAVKDGETVEALKQKNKEVNAFFLQGEILKTCKITVNNQIWTAYPFVADGIVHEITIKSIEEWMNEQEAQIHCSLEDAPLAFFDTMYFKNKGSYEPGKNITFHYPHCLFSEKSEPQFVKDRDGRELSTKGITAYFPFERGDVDDFMFVVPVKEVMELNSGTKRFTELELLFFG